MIVALPLTAGNARGQPEGYVMHSSNRGAACHTRTLLPLFAASALLVSASQLHACDGKPYSLEASVGDVASGGGLQVQIDKLKLLDDVPDKYTISIKDDDKVIADHVVLTQYDTLSFPTRCGKVTIGADRKSMFHHSILTVHWSYF
jgi:hypothetical protein